jgi:hypothetical protein
MKVFISYGDGSDQVTALRLQALGAVNGLTIYVPPAFTRQSVPGFLDPEIAQKLDESEVVLGVVVAGLAESCRQELNVSLAARKNMVVMAYPTFASLLRPVFGSNLVEIDPENPGAAEMDIVAYLTKITAQQQAKTALLALSTLALGLLILAPADQS